MTRDGERYLDFGGGIAVNVLGHAHPHLVAALTEQAGKLWHTSNLFRIPEGERLAQRLVDNTFADLVFFTNSGAEALEASIKMARKYHSANGEPERFRILTFEGFDQVPFGDHEALRRAITPQTGAILIEPVQGEGGIRNVPTQCLRGLRELCDEHGMLLVFDEVQTGVGRTGRLFAHEWSGIEPDIMAIAKGIGGGFPMGACLATAEAAKGMTTGVHGTTFGGNPLAMAVGNAVLDVVLEPGFLDHVRQMSLLLKQRLAALMDRHPAVIAELRGQGLMLGLRTHVANTDFVDAARGERLLTITAGDNVVRLLPPLIVGEAEIGEAVARLERTCEALEEEMRTLARRGAAE